LSAPARRFLLAAAALLLTACPGSEQAPPAPPPKAPADLRVVTAAPAIAEILCAIGAQEQLVGVSRFCTEPASLSSLPRIGGMIDPNLEAIDALQPDLVFLQGRDPRLQELARLRGFSVVGYEIETLAQLEAAVVDLGRRLDRSSEAEALNAQLRTALGEVRASRPATPPRTLVVFNHRPGELGQVSAPGRGTFVGECLEAAGGATCLDDLPALGWHTLSKEVLLAKAPELIVELCVEPVDAAAAARLRADWEVLADIPAVAEGRIAIVSGSDLLIPGPRLGGLVRKLSRAIHGELDVR
jgi:iron complex transport system substrate-binding protein